LSRSIRPDYDTPRAREAAGRGAVSPLMLCDAENPGVTTAGVYHLPYTEAVDGYRHAYRTRHGVQWTRHATHPTDAHCPGCAEMRNP
jgi:hypothetical protein